MASYSSPTIKEIDKASDLFKRSHYNEITSCYTNTKSIHSYMELYRDMSTFLFMERWETKRNLYDILNVTFYWQKNYQLSNFLRT